MDFLGNSEDDNYHFNFDSIGSNKPKDELDNSSNVDSDPTLGECSQAVDQPPSKRTPQINSFAVDQLLEPPFWSGEALPQATFTTIRQLEESLIHWEVILKADLQQCDYNIFQSFAAFYRAYQSSKLPLVDFITTYQPAINIESMSCVALALHLMKQLKQEDSQYGALFAMISCEEQIPLVDDEPQYSITNRDNVKEHVLIGLKFALLEDDRNGYIIIDPGFHISRPIVVMADGVHPHTGWFDVTKNPKFTRKFHYRLVNDQFIEWKVLETLQSTGEIWASFSNIIYIRSVFIKYVSVTEKRAMLLRHKSFVIRSSDGNMAGFHSLMERPDNCRLTIFYEADGKRVSQKFYIAEIDFPEVKEELFKVAKVMNDRNDGISVEERVEQFLGWLNVYKESIYDQVFRREICQIDDWIDALVEGKDDALE